MAAALEMVLPAALGYWGDQQLKTKPIFFILGTIFGMTAGFIHLLQMALPKKPNDPVKKNQANENANDQT